MSDVVVGVYLAGMTSVGAPGYFQPGRGCDASISCSDAATHVKYRTPHLTRAHAHTRTHPRAHTEHLGSPNIRPLAGTEHYGTHYEPETPRVDAMNRKINQEQDATLQGVGVCA